MEKKSKHESHSTKYRKSSSGADIGEDSLKSCRTFADEELAEARYLHPSAIVSSALNSTSVFRDD